MKSLLYLLFYRNPEIMDTHISYRPDLVAPWQRNGTKIQVSGKFGHLINGRNLITPFAERAVVDITLNEDVVWDEVTSPFFDIHQLESVFQPNRGFYSDSPFPCPQKMMALNNHFWTPTMHFGQGNRAFRGRFRGSKTCEKKKRSSIAKKLLQDYGRSTLLG